MQLQTQGFFRPDFARNGFIDPHGILAKAGDERRERREDGYGFSPEVRNAGE